MRFSRVLGAFALVSTTSVIAAPEPVAGPNPAPRPMPNPQFEAPDIIGTLGALGNLLQGDTLNNIVSLIDNGAALLTPQFVNETQTLISTVSGILPALAPLLGSLLGTPPAAA